MADFKTEDWIIVGVLALGVLGGLQQGFFRSVCSLGGLLIGLLLAAWNYARLASLLMAYVKEELVANIVAFFAIAVLVMAVAAIVGNVLSKTIHKMGLGCLDRVAGGVFGLLQGMLLVTLCIVVAVAFYPQAHWLVEAKLPRLFFGACHVSAQMSPAELATRLYKGLRILEAESPAWMHSGKGGL
jgi:membrane protein required for colicin V production